LAREFWSWFGFWAEFVVLGLLAIVGACFASRGGRPGDYATGLILSLTAIALAFFRLKLWFDGAPAEWSRFLLVDDMRNLALAIAVFTALGLAGLFIAAESEAGSLHSAGIALFVTSGLVVFLSLKNVFDTLDRRG
jgi:hypothetical protein